MMREFWTYFIHGLIAGYHFRVVALDAGRCITVKAVRDLEGAVPVVFDAAHELEPAVRGAGVVPPGAAHHPDGRPRRRDVDVLAGVVQLLDERLVDKVLHFLNHLHLFSIPLKIRQMKIIGY